jgi:hypothetical protein
VNIMAGSLSNYTEGKVLEHIVGKTSFTMPSAVYIALLTSAPTDATTGATLAEPSTTGTAYARKLTSGSDWGASTGDSITNAATITFATATGAGWGTITHIALVDNGTVGAGNVLAWGDVSVAKQILSGDTASYPASNLTINLD